MSLSRVFLCDFTLNGSEARFWSSQTTSLLPMIWAVPLANTVYVSEEWLVRVQGKSIKQQLLVEVYGRVFYTRWVERMISILFWGFPHTVLHFNEGNRIDISRCSCAVHAVGDIRGGGCPKRVVFFV